MPTNDALRAAAERRYQDILEFPGYRICTDGTVWTSIYRTGRKTGKGTAVHIGGDWRQMRLAKQRNGYLTVSLVANGKAYRLFVHRLVLLAFIGPCPEGMESAHSDGDRTNNDISNLSWKTPVDNNADKIGHGTLLQGERCPWAKLDAAAVTDILRRRAAGESCEDIAKTMGVRKQAVSDVCTGRRWSHLTGIKYERRTSHNH